MDKLKTIMAGVDLVQFEIHGDERGSLVAIESYKDIDFEIKRTYYIFDTKEGVVRGKHAHKDLKQILVCVNGACDILLDNGVQKEIIHLNTANIGIYIHGLVWREMMNFSQGSVLLALVDHEYNVEDYIYDLDEMKKMVNIEN